jgi:hypothetical protein
MWTAFELETELLIYPKPDSNTVKHGDKTTQLAQKLSAGHPTQDQPQHGILSSSDAVAAHGASPFQIATSEDIGRPASPQITHERSPSPDGPPSRPTGASDGSRRAPEEDDDGEGSMEHHAKLVAPDAPSGKEIAQLEDGQLSETLVAKTELGRRIAQLTDELALKSALLEQAEANAAEEKQRARLELRELQMKLDESLLSRDNALKQAQSTLEKASCAAEANEQSQRELTEMRAELEERRSESAAIRL